MVRPLSPRPGGHTDRVAALLSAICSQERTLTDHAAALGIPASTAYRIVDALIRHGLVHRTKRGHVGPGLALASLAQRLDERAIVARIARPHIRRLARQVRATVHLGFFDDDLVTYLVKEHGGGTSIFTTEGGQLEAWCSAIGKIVLGRLSDADLTRYLMASPLVRLTDHTVIDPAAVWADVRSCATEGIAFDRQEIADGLFCVAVPVRASDPLPPLAMSISRLDRPADARDIASLREAASAIGDRLAS